MVTYWLYLDKELSELMIDFQNIFDCSDFVRDYENHWEWIEAYILGLDCKINISRPHNWKTGNYLEPIIVRLYIDDKHIVNEEFIEFYGNNLSGAFNKEVMFGDVINSDGNKTDFIVKSTFN